MTLFIIGLGLNEKSISLEALEILKRCQKIYLEGYTVDFLYDIKTLEKVICKKIQILNREQVENEKFADDAKKIDVVLLVYGSPFFATTHISLIEKAKKERINFRILYNASVFDAIGETGLQLYKFGKITSLPKWKENYKPDSFADIIEENLKINAHTLILVDIGLKFERAIEQFKQTVNNKNIKIDKIIICSQLGTKDAKIYCSGINNIEKLNIKAPFCFIIPSNSLNFKEKEALERL